MAIAGAMASAIAEAMAEGIGGSNGQANVTTYVTYVRNCWSPITCSNHLSGSTKRKSTREQRDVEPEAA